MKDYYHYLWSTTWPNLIVLFLIFLVVFTRLGWKFFNTWCNKRNFLGFLFWIIKACFWTGLLGVYFDIFLLSQPDWFYKPGVINESVQGMAYDSGTSSYLLDIRSGSEREQFYIDYRIYGRLKVDDQVELMYLPVRREVIRCELISGSKAEE